MCGTDSLVAHRRKVDPHEASPSEPTSSRRGDGETRQYWLRNIDTLAAIAIRFGVSTHELCLLNALPRAVLSTSPHLLHTRAFILIPAHAVDQQLAANPELAAHYRAHRCVLRAKRPPRPDAMRRPSSAPPSRATPPPRARHRRCTAGRQGGARVRRAGRRRVSPARFGEGTDADGLALPYDSDEAARMHARRGTCAQIRCCAHPCARTLAYGLGLGTATARKRSRSFLRVRAPAPAPTPPTDPAEKDAASTSAVGRWFARALNAMHPMHSEVSTSRDRHAM